MNAKVKICGIKDPEIAKQTSESGADMVGVIFFERSPRNTDFLTAKKIQTALKASTKLVAVTVNANDEFITEMLEVFKPDYIQLHGSETKQRALDIKNKFNLKIIKAISIETTSDLKKAEEFSDISDYILFDAKAPKNSLLPGGNAVSFDWNILKDHMVSYKWALSGGLNINNLKEAKNISKAAFFDVSSGVESSPGIKDINLIKKFIDLAKK